MITITKRYRLVNFSFCSSTFLAQKVDFLKRTKLHLTTFASQRFNYCLVWIKNKTKINRIPYCSSVMKRWAAKVVKCIFFDFELRPVSSTWAFRASSVKVSWKNSYFFFENFAHKNPKSSAILRSKLRELRSWGRGWKSHRCLLQVSNCAILHLLIIPTWNQTKAENFLNKSWGPTDIENDVIVTCLNGSSAFFNEFRR